MLPLILQYGIGALVGHEIYTRVKPAQGTAIRKVEPQHEIEPCTTQHEHYHYNQQTLQPAQQQAVGFSGGAVAKKLTPEQEQFLHQQRQHMLGENCRGRPPISQSKVKPSTGTSVLKEVLERSET